MPLSLIFWKPLWPNFRKGGMKKVLEEEIVAKSNYATITRICVAESSGAKTSFWPKVLEILKKADFDEIQSTTEGIREVTRWECPLDKNIIHA